MNKLIKKNILQRQIVQNFEKKRTCLKIIQNNFLLPTNIRWKIYQYYLKFNQNSSLTQIKNKCIITGRSKSIYRFFKMSRLQLRLFVSQGKLTGFSKHYW